MEKKMELVLFPTSPPGLITPALIKGAPGFAFPLFSFPPRSLLPPHFLPQLKRKPEWASSAPPVFKHLTRSLVSSFLQLIQEADKYC